MNSFIWKNPANAGGNITQLEQKVQQLEQTIQQLTGQIQTLTQNLADKAGKSEANNFTQKQKITTPNQALTLIQDNNANYISFETTRGDRRGYVGMGSSGSNKIHLNGKDGVQITSTTGDLELNPAGSINANNKPILNVGQSNEATAALSLSALAGKIKFEVVRNINIGAGRTFTVQLQNNISALLGFSIWANAPKWDVTSYVESFSLSQNTITFTKVPSGAVDTEITLFYI